MQTFNHRTDQGYDYCHKETENDIRSEITKFLFDINIKHFLLDIDINKIVYKRNKKTMFYQNDWYHPFKIILKIDLKSNNNIYTVSKLFDLLKDMYMYSFIDIKIDDSVRLNNTNIKKNIKKLNKRNKNICTIDLIYNEKDFFSYFVEFHSFNFDITKLYRKNISHYKYAYSIKFSDILSICKKINININESKFEYDFDHIHQKSMPRNYKNDYKQCAIEYYDFIKYLYDSYNGIYKNELEKVMNILTNMAKGEHIFVNYDL